VKYRLHSDSVVSAACASSDSFCGRLIMSSGPRRLVPGHLVDQVTSRAGLPRFLSAVILTTCLNKEAVSGAPEIYAGRTQKNRELSF
jgi:hypothetical protein